MISKKLKEGWDVVGLSFYLSETHEALEMVEAARQQAQARSGPATTGR